MAAINNDFAHLVYRVHGGLHASLFHAIAPGKGLARQDIGVLGFLHTVDSTSISEAAEKCHMAKSQLSLIVERLVEKGFVERERDEIDRRVARLSSTRTGEKALVEAYGGVRARVEDFFSPLSSEELATVRRAFELISGLLGEENRSRAS